MILSNLIKESSSQSFYIQAKIHSSFRYIVFIFQKSCINFCIQAKPMEVYVPEETSGCLYHIWRLVTSPPFENFILFLIVLNTLLLMMKVRNKFCFENTVSVLSSFSVLCDVTMMLSTIIFLEKN